MTKKIALHFLRGYGNYNGGDIAGFDPDHAEKLITQGFAKKAAAQPETVTLAQLKIEGTELNAMVDKAVAELRTEIEGDISAREVALRERAENLEALAARLDTRVEELSQREQAIDLRLQDVIKREGDLEARITAMKTNVNVTVDENGEVQAVVQAVSEEAAKPKTTGLPKQGK